MRTPSLLESFLGSPITWGVVALVALALALSGKLSMGAARSIMWAACCSAVFGIYRAETVAKLDPLMRFLILGCCALGFSAATVAANRWMSAPKVTASEAAPTISRPPSDPKSAPPTLVDLFKSEFPNTMKVTDDKRAIKWGEDGTVLPIKRQMYLDFPAKAKFVGFYVPSSPHTYKACLLLADEVLPTLSDMPKDVAISGGYRGERNTIQDLTFSGRVVLYHEDFVPIVQKAEIIKAFAARHLDVQFRGPDYLMDQVVAWHHQHDPH